MFGIGGTELFIIVFFALLVFGPDKLPKLGRTIGKWYGEFKRAQDTMQAQIKSEMEAMEKATSPVPVKADETDTDAADEEPVESEDGPEDTEDTEDTEPAEPAAARKSVITDPDWDEEEEEE